MAVAPKGFSFADATGPRLIGAAFIDTPAGHAALGTACTLASRARGLVRVLTVCEPPNPVVTGMLDALALEQVRTSRQNAVVAVLARGLDAVRIGRSAGGEIRPGSRPKRSPPRHRTSTSWSAAHAGRARSARFSSAAPRTRSSGRRRAPCSSCRPMRPPAQFDERRRVDGRSACGIRAVQPSEPPTGPALTATTTETVLNRADPPCVKRLADDASRAAQPARRRRS